MAFSFSFSLDLNLAPPTHTWGQTATRVWKPYFRFHTRTNYRMCVLGTWDDNRVVSDVMTLSVQSAASFPSVGHRFIVKSHEVQVLRAQLVAERNLVEDCERTIRRLKRERVKMLEEKRHQLEILQEENQKLLKMVDFYSKDMKSS
ncbi:hypothetical protein L3X38_028555 [Prunus dulcis]|uniref:Uncharacterized protein n=1 Tax=Prunus dulcis TaxID=3755 RepID=A0AAD4VRC9_PRUDU|nr:hypothetical protein L3X38_028555 [Prunus dulcis]